jgi:GT2 family glycosyltransferase
VQVRSARARRIEEPAVTVVVTARERFSAARASLESLLADTSCVFDIVYVDGGSPPALRRYLERSSKAKPFRLVRENRYLSPNEARNIGFRHVATKYVAFIDNDVIVSDGWLKHLVACAEETGADIVGPLYLEGDSAIDTIHMAGGDANIVATPDGQRVLREGHRFAGFPVAAGHHPVSRTPTELLEFHCMLVRRELFDRLGPLDEQLRSVSEHVDFCMLARTAGASIVLEPNSVVRYLRPTKLTFTDLPFFMLRWSEAWNRSSVNHLVQKWKLSRERSANYEVMEFGRSHRLLLIAPILAGTARSASSPQRFAYRLAMALERRFNRYLLPVLLRVARVR